MATKTNKNMRPASDRRKYKNMKLTDHFPDIASKTSSRTKKSSSEQLLAEIMPAIRDCARKVSAKIGIDKFGLTVEDLVSVGTITALESVEKFNDKRASFLGYALQRIQGSMIDHIRDNTPVPRTQIARLRTLFADQLNYLDPASAKLPNGQKEFNSRQEASTALAIGALFPLSLDAVTTNDAVLYHEVISTEEDQTKNGLSEEDHIFLNHILSTAMTDDLAMEYIGTQLLDKEKEVLKLFIEGHSGVEMARIMDVTESRICQLHASLFRKLQTLASNEKRNLSLAS